MLDEYILYTFPKLYSPSLKITLRITFFKYMFILSEVSLHIISFIEFKRLSIKCYQ